MAFRSIRLTWGAAQSPAAPECPDALATKDFASLGNPRNFGKANMIARNTMTGLKSISLSTLALAALLPLLAGCAEEPKPGPATTDTSAANNTAGRTPITDDAPAQPPMQSEPETATAVTPKPVTPEELEAIVAQSEGKVVLVDFWATWCGPCIAQFPHTVELSKTHAKDLVVLAVAMNQTDEETLEEVGKVYAAHGSGNVQPLISADGDSEEAYAAFQITNGALPHYKLIGRDGQLIKAFGGDVDNPLDPAEINAAIAEAVKQEG